MHPMPVLRRHELCGQQNTDDAELHLRVLGEQHVLRHEAVQGLPLLRRHELRRKQNTDCTEQFLCILGGVSMSWDQYPYGFDVLPAGIDAKRPAMGEGGHYGHC